MLFAPLLFFIMLLNFEVDQLNQAFYLRNKTSVPVFYHRIKYKYEFVCV